MNEKSRGTADLLALTLAVLEEDDPADVDPWNPATWKPQLLPGRLPPGLPAAVPIPDRSSVLGSWLQVTQDSYAATIVLDTEMSQADVLQLYRDRSATKGWSERDPGPSDGSAQSTAWVVALLHEETGAELDVEIVGAANRSEVRLEVFWEPPRKQRWDEAPAGHPRSVLPRLKAPAGGHQAPAAASSWSDDRAYSTWEVQTDHDVDSIHRHYGEQLQEAGWTSLVSGHDGPVAGSTWSFQDPDGHLWHGTLCIVETHEEPRTYLLDVRGRRESPVSPSNRAS